MGPSEQSEVALLPLRVAPWWRFFLLKEAPGRTQGSAHECLHFVGTRARGVHTASDIFVSNLDDASKELSKKVPFAHVVTPSLHDMRATGTNADYHQNKNTVKCKYFTVFYDEIGILW